MLLIALIFRIIIPRILRDLWLISFVQLIISFPLIFCCCFFLLLIFILVDYTHLNHIHAPTYTQTRTPAHINSPEFANTRLVITIIDVKRP